MEKKRFNVKRTAPKTALELAEQQETEIAKLKSENEELIYKLNTIDDYYQKEIEKLREHWKTETSSKIQQLEDKIKDLESRALANPRKITDIQVDEVKNLRSLGLSYRKIAKKTALGTATICRIINGEYDK